MTPGLLRMLINLLLIRQDRRVARRARVRHDGLGHLASLGILRVLSA